MELIFADDTNLFLSHKDIDTLFNSTMWNLQVSQRGLSQTNSLWMLIKLNGCYFILCQKGGYFHSFCLAFLLKIYISKGSM